MRVPSFSNCGFDSPGPPARLLLVLTGLLLSGCAQTLRQQYLDAGDPCSSAREPIVNAGDELNARYKQMADQQAAAQMKGHELPVVTQNGNQMQFNFGNALANAIQQTNLSNQAYLRMKQQETGANAAALLASVEGDANSDRARLQSVTHAMANLRECRATQVAAARTAAGSESDRLDKLRKQQAKLNEDDQLVASVFGQYGNRAQLYAEATSTVPEAPAGRSGHSHTGRRTRVAARSSIEALKDDQRTAQIADRKQSETLHETLQSSIAGA